MSERDKSTIIRIFTTKGDAESRIVSVRLVNGFDPRPLFDLGMAIDGNAAIAHITATSASSLTQALFEFQRNIVAVIEAQRYVVAFA